MESLKLFSDLYARTNIANKTIEEIIDSFAQFFKSCLEDIGEKIRTSSDKEAAITTFKKLTFYVTNAFKSFNTKQKLVTALVGRNVYKEPEIFLLNRRIVEKHGNIDEKESHGVIMPIKHQIKLFLELPNVFQRIIHNQSQGDPSGNYTSVIDGELWRKIVEKYERKHVIPVFLYNDDFQPDNQISPHSSTNKLSAFYYSFPTLPDYLALNLKTIFIAALVKAKEIEYANILEQEFDPALFALFEVFSDLERNGVSIKVNGKSEVVFIVLPQFLGDNLSINSCLGFMRGFTAIYICRICLMPKDIREQATKEMPELLRNKENFEEGLNGKNRDERKGVAYNCILNFLDNFKVYENFSVDSMHDVYLGVFKSGISFILYYYIIDNKIFTLSDFNEVKRNFDYGKKEAGNKTVDISESHLTSNLQMSAREVWALVEFLPLMLMTLVRDYEHSPAFKLSLKMIDVLKCISRSSFSERDIMEMEEEISNHHRLYLELTANTNSISFSSHITPKFHNMLHYGTVVRKAGPLKKTMAFRFEQKHQELKQYARACYSRVNLPYSICAKFCLESSRLFLDKGDIFTLIKDIVYFNVYMRKEGLYPCEVSEPIKTLKYKAVKYDIGDLVYHNEAAFKIKEIVRCLSTEEIYLFCNRLDIEYIEKLRFFKILNENDQCETLKISSLDYAPVKSHCVSQDLYFRLKYF